MEANVSFSSPPSDSILQEARLLNSDLGRHSVKSNFSTRLAGRFYSNGSLERHALRRSSLLGMMERKRGLERELLLEERRVELLLERLRETEKARENAHALISTIERGVLKFQTVVRRGQALKLFHAMQHELLMRKLVAQVFQCRYRGWKGRAWVESKREHLRQKQRDESLLAIQTFARGRIQRIRYLALLMKRRQLLINRSATAIQAVMRGKLLWRIYRTELIRRHDGARNIQRIWRGFIGRGIATKLRDDLLLREQIVEEKPKRIPLHLRKYSTYGVSDINNDVKRKTSLATNCLKKREVIARRRNSDLMVKTMRRLSSSTIPKSVMSAADEPENDSVATTLTSLTNQTVATERTSKQPIRHKANPSSPSLRNPQRVLAPSPQRRGTMQSCDEVGARRATLDRRKNATCGISAPIRKSSLHHTDSVSKLQKPSSHSCNDSVSKPPIPLRKSSLQSSKGYVSKPTLVTKPPIPREGLKWKHADSTTTCGVQSDREPPNKVVEVPRASSELLIEGSMNESIIISAEAALLVQKVLENAGMNVSSALENRKRE